MAATDLTKRTCAPCEGGVAQLGFEKVRELLLQVPGWCIGPDGQRLTRFWRVNDFAEGLDFFRRIGEVAEAANHHPDLHLANYRDLTVEIWTHAVDGLTENDFILAAKINEMKQPRLKSVGCVFARSATRTHPTRTTDGAS